MSKSENKGGFGKAVLLFVIVVVVGLVLMEATGTTNLRDTSPHILENFQQAIPATSESSTTNSNGFSVSREFAGNPPSPMPDGSWPEIHSKHFLHGYPLGTPHTNDLIIRDIYAMSNNDDTKFADWLAYRLDIKSITSDTKTERKWKPDPWLAENETLEPDDYKDAHATLNTDRGHQAPLASFKGTETWHETNYLSNITPQKSELNQGPWVDLENAVRDLVSKRGDKPVYVMTGPFYEEYEAPLPKADEDHRIPSGYWKIISITNGDGAVDESVAFIFDQETPRSADHLDHVVSIRQVELRSGLNFFSDLDDNDENKLEEKVNDSWAKSNL